MYSLSLIKRPYLLVNRQEGTRKLILEIIKYNPHLDGMDEEKLLFSAVKEALAYCYLDSLWFEWYLEDAHDRIFGSSK